MKRLFAFLITVFAGTLVFAQQQNVPKAVKNAYAAKYAASATYAKKGDLYAAEFTDKGDSYAAYFTEDGTWVKTEKVVTFETLKESVRSEIQQRFLGGNSSYKLDKPLIIETPNGTFDAARFFMESGGTITIYFDDDAKMVRRDLVK